MVKILATSSDFLTMKFENGYIAVRGWDLTYICSILIMN